MIHRWISFLFVPVIALAMIAKAEDDHRGLSVGNNPRTWGTYHALIIGIDDYWLWPKLRTAVKDATALQRILVDKYGFQEKHVILRQNREASRRQLIKDLRNLAAGMSGGDNLLIYFAGHGQLDDLTGDGYWIPAEGELKDPATWLANSYVKAVIGSDRVEAKNVIIIADSCYSGAMIWGGPSLLPLETTGYTEKLMEAASRRSRQIITSGGVEPVADGGAEGHSLFAYQFLKALDKNDRPVIDMENLFHDQVFHPVKEIGNQHPSVGRLKTPMDDDGQFVLVNQALLREGTGKTGETPIEMAGAAASDGTPSTMAVPQRFNAEEEMWAIVKMSTVPEDYDLYLKEYPDGRFSAAALLRKKQLKRLDAGDEQAAGAPFSVSGTEVVAVDGDYTQYANGIVFDRRTGLEWYVGPDEDITWKQAKKWVSNLKVAGGRWRLPAVDEVKSIFQKGKGRRNMSPLFKTRGWYVWLGEMDNEYIIGTYAGYYFYSYYFDGNGRLQIHPSTVNYKIRVFAVRPRDTTATTKRHSGNQ